MSVGYEYESCASLILWEKRTAILQGYELDPTSLGGWSLDKHHILNTRSGMDKYTSLQYQLQPLGQKDAGQGIGDGVHVNLI